MFPRPTRASLFTAHGLPPGGSPMPTNVSLIATGDELILVDAGSGANFQPTAGKLAENMEAAGLDPAKVTKVVFTHGHADHLWGAIDDFDDSERFANASYVISGDRVGFLDPSRHAVARAGLAQGHGARQRPHPQAAGEQDRAAQGRRRDRARRLLSSTRPGHTPGHMSVLVESGGERLLIGADALTHPAVSFARPDWRWGTDYDGDRAIATRRRLLDQLSRERTTLIGFHLPWPGIGMVETSGTAYRFVPLR